SEWPPLQAPLKPPTPTASEPDSPQPTLLPSIVKQKSQVCIYSAMLRIDHIPILKKGLNIVFRHFVLSNRKTYLKNILDEVLRHFENSTTSLSKG
ncbi:unnamed protein product, partial [Rotaria sordida]